jgi:hypothetical protein
MAPLMSSPPPPLVPQTGGARVFALLCIDPRFSELVDWFLIHQAQVRSEYDQFSLAGAELGVMQAAGGAAPSGATATWPVFSTWAQTMFDTLKLAIALHGVQEFWVFSHAGCGAYKAFALPSGSQDTDVGPHETQMLALQALLLNYTDSDADVQAAVRALAFKGYWMSLDGAVNQVIDDGRGIVVEPPTADPPRVHEGGGACSCGGACGEGGDGGGCFSASLLPLLLLVVAGAAIAATAAYTSRKQRGSLH